MPNDLILQICQFHLNKHYNHFLQDRTCGKDPLPDIVQDHLYRTL